MSFFLLIFYYYEVMAKVTPVCHSFCSQGGSASVHAGMQPPRSRHPPGADPQSRHPLRSRPPQEQTPPPWSIPPRSRYPPRADTPQSRTPRRQTPQSPPPLGADPPRNKHPPPPREANSSIWSTTSWYTSYWNAFLLLMKSITSFCSYLTFIETL